MELTLKGKTAIVTGGSKGIGAAIGRRFAEAGANVMLSSRKLEGLEAAAAQMRDLDGEVAVFAANAGSAEQAQACVDETLKRFGAVDILINNAATNPYFGPLLEIDQPRAQKMTDVNQFGYLMWAQLVVGASMGQHGGSIINLASVGGLETEPNIGWYNVTKAAVIHLTRQLAFELAPKVRVNALAPGLVKTDFARALWEPHEERIARHIPLGRLGEPDDIAKAALFVASDAASWLTGHTLVIDGGSTAQPNGSVG